MKRADGSTVITAYTPNSQVANVTVTAAATGNPIQVGQTSYTYDANDRLTKQTNPDGSFIAYGFDAAGNILQRSTAVGTVQYTYDSNGQIATVTDASGKTTNYTYNSVGRPDTIVLPNGTAGGYSYDINGRLLQLAHQKTDGTVVVGVRYTLASNGQRIKVEEYDSVSTLVANVLNNPARTYDYQYDLVGRLTQDKRTDRGGVQVRTTTYAYDQVGNRTTKTEINGSGTTTTTYSYDANDRLTTETKTPPTGSAIVTTYAWDANGNLISKIVGAQATFYSWSSDNRLAMVMQGQSEATAITIAKFTYDASGNRIGKIEPGQNGQPDKVTTYLIDSSFGFAQVVLETVTFGSTTTSTAYTWGNGLIAQSSAGQQSYFYSNGLNSTVALADAAGNTTDTYSYEAFGAIENRTGITVNSFRFAGEYADDTIDNIYLRDRWLDQNIGRFISMDRFPGSVSRPATLNKYNYAHSDPVNGTDPSGMMTLDEIGETLDIEGTLTSMVKDQLGGLLQNQIYGDDDTVDGQPSLYDMMMGMLLKTVAGSFSMAAAPVGFTMMAGGKTEGHHVIPEYMCGAAKQELVDLPIAAHKKLHNELFAFDLSVTVASKVYDLLFKKKKSGQLKSPINKIARTSQGRAAIAIGLGIFYENYGYDGVPFADLGHGRTTFLPVGPVLLEEAVRFAGNDHQYSATIPCKKY
ncbi:MAG TPA: RHS repeat-associated core domain-containing protein, partial [Methylobacter sp.]